MGRYLERRSRALRRPRNESNNPAEEQIPEVQQLSDEAEHKNGEDIKTLQTGLARNELSGQARVNIRRALMWDDFKEARMKNRITPNNMLKVVFVGEPAVDDGGPRREFFSGVLD